MANLLIQGLVGIMQIRDDSEGCIFDSKAIQIICAWESMPNRSYVNIYRYIHVRIRLQSVLTPQERPRQRDRERETDREREREIDGERERNRDRAARNDLINIDDNMHYIYFTG